MILPRLHMENQERYLRQIDPLISFEPWHGTFMRRRAGGDAEFS
jgi:hypothetical protein